MEIDNITYQKLLQERLLFRQAGGMSGDESSMFDFPVYQNFKILFHFYNDVEYEGDNNTKDSGSNNTNNSGSNSQMSTGLLHPTWTLLSPAWTDKQYSALNIDADEEDLYNIMNQTYGAAYGAEFPNAWVEQSKFPKRAYELGWWRYNTAFSYLMQNNEIERAGYLRRFIELLSNISSNSPWYFQNIKGLDEAIKRPQTNTDFMFKERQMLTIECLSDSADQRIGTMLDLYRAAVWSWEHKKEIIPANLRKFDMSIVVFQLPINTIHCPQPSALRLSSILGMTANPVEYSEPAGFASVLGGNLPKASYKIYEFHNCEFDYSSSMNAGEHLSNAEIKDTVYNIRIFYDDMYEIRYNEFMPDSAAVFANIYAPAAEITDVLESKIYKRISSLDDDTDVVRPYAEYNERANKDVVRMVGAQYDISSQLSQAAEGLFTGSKVGQALHVVNSAQTYVNKFLMGNIFKFSVKNITDIAQDMVSGNLAGVAQDINQLASGADGNMWYNGLVDRELGDLFEEDENTHRSSKDLGSLHTPPVNTSPKSLQKLYDSLPEESYTFSENIGNILGEVKNSFSRK